MFSRCNSSWRFVFPISIRKNTINKSLLKLQFQKQCFVKYRWLGNLSLNKIYIYIYIGNVAEALSWVYLGETSPRYVPQMFVKYRRAGAFQTQPNLEFKSSTKDNSMTEPLNETSPRCSLKDNSTTEPLNETSPRCSLKDNSVRYSQGTFLTLTFEKYS
jgi:hypothetical protein